ncbi:hypothetical protein CCR94_23945 [Rhodoblastus sphagnicola]|uniref:Uncharacterized protein n=1 Tax=Rhodoblastus sphagnicola TaxID=333368 RepID=A0A2S6MTZ4_9HYPH|nr:hypothetical protein [Rhodoblastus sphagnicola]MBB4199766.1 Fe-S-cluster-containing hydrogenase component 2 [Rhodoblastus sphagnicola]PPQ25827.1 hypothetical protein CCR94_23945 [Rhodoblastus sphagnicola]
MIGSPSQTQTEQPSAAQCDACPADCLDACFNEAIVAASGGGVEIEAANCAGCGACVPACEFGFIRLHDGVARIVFPEGKPNTPESSPSRAPQWSE